MDLNCFDRRSATSGHSGLNSQFTPCIIIIFVGSGPFYFITASPLVKDEKKCSLTFALDLLSFGGACFWQQCFPPSSSPLIGINLTIYFKVHFLNGNQWHSL